MEGAKVVRYIGTQIAQDPLTHRFNFIRGVIVPWYQQGTDLQPDPGLVFYVNECVEYVVQVCATKPVVEIL